MSSIDTTSSHYKGKFSNIYEVQEKYPNGGVDGDYVDIAGWAHYWEADRGTWCVNEKRDEYWDELLTQTSSDMKALSDKVTHETSDRKSGDEDLDKKISDERTARSDADTTLQGNIDAEAKARTSADTTLQGNIDAEAKARADTDSSMQTTLQGNIDAEAKARTSADTTLQGNIDAEAKARTSADTTLQGNIDAEAKTRADAVALLQGNIDALAQAGYRFMGIATPDTNPGTPSQDVFCIATKEGTYSNFGTGEMMKKEDGSIEETKISIAEGEIAFLLYNGYVESSDDTTITRALPGWKKLTLDISEAVVKIVKEKLAGIEDGVAPLDREGVVPMDYLPVWDIKDKLMVSCTQEEYDAMVKAGTVKDDTYYNILEE